MFVGLLFAIGASFVWGLIFVIPGFLTDFTGVEIVIGRYVVYGVLSSVLLFKNGLVNLKRYDLRDWIKAFTFALLSNIIYYLGIIAGLRFATPPVTVLLIGMAPILIAVYGNWSVREISYYSLILPSVLIAGGMVLVNFVGVDWSFSSYTIQQYIFGLLGVIVALVGWSWYAVNNARFLKRNPHIPGSEWSTVIGVGTLVWSLLLAGAFAIGMNDEFGLSKFFVWSPSLLYYLIGVGILGIVCSWLGCFLWNCASSYLPVSLMGPFLIFETIFGLTFVFLAQKHRPSLMECLGIAVMLSGILLSIYVFKKQQFKHN